MKPYDLEMNAPKAMYKYERGYTSTLVQSDKVFQLGEGQNTEIYVKQCIYNICAYIIGKSPTYLFRMNFKTVTSCATVHSSEPFWFKALDNFHAFTYTL